MFVSVVKLYHLHFTITQVLGCPSVAGLSITQSRTMSVCPSEA